ncbi:amidophosphoribosyltransferase [Candidatus Viridilinea mediisalina]|uniref:Amidophosphoribosyltransferase n=1 Tax=Candidatus Viridilinea mediisalina TaxID=2024553 RepID=A0A2A6RM32_9CHLR|nr:amidophosphoribosyltransferase [Candidatus Viridilinea mediisalina]PDW03938.1 amidophosphoribosyltransferase [Candidatus Viridilinea mediisalina]
MLCEDKPAHECGVFAIVAPELDVARLTFFGLYALQHRGQESAGIAVANGRAIRYHKAMGLVSQVFNEENLRPLAGYVAIGHTRYSTTGSSKLENAQPFVVESALGPLAVGHNGNLTNAATLRRELLLRGVGLTGSSDSEVITQMLAGGEGRTWEEKLKVFMVRAQGAYCLTVLTRDAVFGVRDPLGLHPLCVGRLGERNWLLASESCAFGPIGAEFVRAVEPGEIVMLTEEGPQTLAHMPTARPAECLFEYIYFARPDSMLHGRTLHAMRVAQGRELARESPAEADLVIPVPDSATPAAIGYAQGSGLPYSEGLIKNRYIGRTFIQPDDQLRKVGISLKFNALGDNLVDKRVVLIDDSIVRGNTSGPIVRLLREAGAREVHVRVSSPPIRHPCFLGVDMATYPELIAYRLTIDEICKHLGADSLAYLSLEGLIRACRHEGDTFCKGCFSGRYPVDVELVDKEVFEIK